VRIMVGGAGVCSTDLGWDMAVFFEQRRGEVEGVKYTVSDLDLQSLATNLEDLPVDHQRIQQGSRHSIGSAWHLPQTKHVCLHPLKHFTLNFLSQWL